MKRASAVLLGLSCACLYAEISSVPFSTTPFDINLTPSPNLRKVEVNADVNQHYEYAFRDMDDKYEIRVTTFSVVDGHSGPITERQFYAFTTTISFNIAGSPDNIVNTIPFNSASLRTDYNAEAGYAVFIYDEDLESEYLMDNTYGLINYFLNRDQGIICQVIMFKNTDVMDDPDYSTDFNTIASFVD